MLEGASFDPDEDGTDADNVPPSRYGATTTAGWMSAAATRVSSADTQMWILRATGGGTGFAEPLHREERRSSVRSSAVSYASHRK
jgi:hypothetical protein